MTPPAKDKDLPLEPPSPSLLRKLELASLDTVAKLLGMPNTRNKQRVSLTEKQREQIREIEEATIIKFRGDLTELEAALGMLRLGHYVGWKVLYLIHSKKTVRKYEEILDIRIRDTFEPTGPMTDRSIGFALAERFSNFWKVAGGTIKIPHKQQAID